MDLFAKAVITQMGYRGTGRHPKLQQHNLKGGGEH